MTFSPSDLPARIELLESLAFMATEHEASLDVLSLIAYVDLYARHLELAHADGHPDALPLEVFVTDTEALEIAALEAERVSGMPTRSPGPLGAPMSRHPSREEAERDAARLVAAR